MLLIATKVDISTVASLPHIEATKPLICSKGCIYAHIVHRLHNILLQDRNYFPIKRDHFYTYSTYTRLCRIENDFTY